MIQVIYGSSETYQMTQEDLLTILGTSRKNNKTKDITGMLLYNDGNFLQVLEGEKDVVEPLMAVISEDNRHDNVTIYYQHDIPEREFGSWEMAFLRLAGRDIQNAEGFTDFVSLKQLRDTFSQEPSRAKIFMSAFLQSVR